MATTIRYRGGIYIGEYRDSQRKIQTFLDTNCDPKIIKDMEYNLVKGYPTKIDYNIHIKP